LHDSNSLGWKIETAAKGPLQIIAQRGHEPSLCPGFGGSGGRWRRAIGCCQKNLAALAAQSSYFASLEKQVASREIKIGLDLNLQLAR
jgi:hypothetical protein